MSRVQPAKTTAFEVHPWLALLLPLMLVPLMISGKSFWIDEFATWQLASLPDLETFADQLFHNPFSEGQMPLAMFFSWIHLHLFGDGEWALRSMNYPWLIIAITAAWTLGRRFGASWFALALAVHPFFWFYADEFRPYAIIISTSTVLLYQLLKAVVDPLSQSPRDTVIMGVAAVVLSASSLLAMFSLGVFYAIAALYIFIQRKSLRTFVLRLRWQAPFLLLLGGYYVMTVLRGAGGAKLWSVNLSSIAFSVYELLGFLGLGPGRLGLRTAGREGMSVMLSAMQPFLVPLGCLALFYAVVGVLCLKRAVGRTPISTGGPGGWVIGFVCMSIVANIGLLFVTAWVVGFPFWGRHLAPVLPYTVLATGIAVSYAADPRGQRVGFSVMFGLLLLSSLQIRFAERHHKDDYRSAAAVAATSIADGETVWWVASPWGAQYYGLTSAETVETGTPFLSPVGSPDAAELAARPIPDKVIYSKPDVYDVRKAVQEYLATRDYHPVETFPAFSIWEKSTEPHSP